MTASILIVEDTSTQAKALKRMLEGGGYTVSIAMGAEEAIKLMGSESHQMVLVDVNMPDVDGYEFCRRVKADSTLSAVPAVLMVSCTQVSDIHPILSCGADDIVLKSFDSRYFLSAVKRVMDNASHSPTSDNPADADDKQKFEVSTGAERFEFSAAARRVASMLVSAFDIAVYQQKCK